jgi:hypothetical protein
MRVCEKDFEAGLFLLAQLFKASVVVVVVFGEDCGSGGRARERFECLQGVAGMVFGGNGGDDGDGGVITGLLPPYESVRASSA